MQTYLTVADNCATVRLKDRFEFSAHREFREVAKKALDSSEKNICIDLREVSYMDSSALGMLLMLKEQANNAQKNVRIVNPSGDVKRILEIANFQKLFPMSQ